MFTRRSAKIYHKSFITSNKETFRKTYTDKWISWLSCFCDMRVIFWLVVVQLNGQLQAVSVRQQTSAGPQAFHIFWLYQFNSNDLRKYLDRRRFIMQSKRLLLMNLGFSSTERISSTRAEYFPLTWLGFVPSLSVQTGSYLSVCVMIFRFVDAHESYLLIDQWAMTSQEARGIFLPSW